VLTVYSQTANKYFNFHIGENYPSMHLEYEDEDGIYPDFVLTMDNDPGIFLQIGFSTKNIFDLMFFAQCSVALARNNIYSEVNQGLSVGDSSSEKSMESDSEDERIKEEFQKNFGLNNFSNEKEEIYVEEEDILWLYKALERRLVDTQYKAIVKENIIENDNIQVRYKLETLEKNLKKLIETKELHTHFQKVILETKFEEGEVMIAD
jgi:hypothetical protein